MPLCILLSKQEISCHIYPLTILINISLHHLSVSKHAKQIRLGFKNSKKKVEGLNTIALQFTKDLSIHGGTLTT